MRPILAAGVLAVGLVGSGCTTLSSLRNVVQPLQFSQSDEQPAEIRLLPPAADRPLGGAGVRLWIEIDNPNPFAVTLSTLQATLLLEDRRAATGDFPLGLALRAGEDSTVPLDLSIGFGDIPGLADVARRIANGDGAPYRLDGTFGVEAGPLGELTFGPMTLVTGELRPSLP